MTVKENMACKVTQFAVWTRVSVELLILNLSNQKRHQGSFSYNSLRLCVKDFKLQVSSLLFGCCSHFLHADH